VSIFEHYRGLIDALVVDSVDADSAARLPIPTFSTATLVTTLDDRLRLARFVLECARTLAPN